MDLEVKSGKMKGERGTLERNEGGVSMDLRRRMIHREIGVKQNCRGKKMELKERRKGKIGEMGLRLMGRGSSFEDDRRQICSDKWMRERERFEAEEER